MPEPEATPASAATETQATGSRLWLRLALGVAAVAALVLVARQAGDYVPAAAQAVEELGFWGPFAFVLVYAAAAVAFVPGSLLTLAGGAIFGLLWGTVYVFLAAVLASSCAFLVARYLARDAVARRIAGNTRFEAVDRAIGGQGFKIMLLLRLSPAFPFSLGNYAMGLTRISFRDYLLASVGMLPATVLYVYYGKVVGDVAALAAGAQPDRGPGEWALLGLGLAATIAVTALVTRVARRALDEAAHLEAVPE